MSDEGARAAIQWFDGEAEAYAARNPGPSEHLELVLDALPPGAKVLDLGCGPGTDARVLHDRGHHVTALDAAPAMIALARARHPGIDFRVADMRGSSWAEGSFDAVVALFSLIFVPKGELPSLLARLHAALRAGGLLLVAVQGGRPSDVGEETIFSVMTRSEVEGLLRGAGFTLESVFERAHHPHERPYRKIHVLARRP